MLVENSQLAPMEGSRGNHSSAVVHEMQIEREEPLEALRLLLEWDHPDVLVRLLDLCEENLAVGPELHSVIILAPASGYTVRQRRGSVLEVDLAIMDDVLIF